MMAYLSSLSCEALPAGIQVPSRSSRRSRPFLMILFAFMLFASLISYTNASYTPQSELELDEDAANFVRRATTGDKYLIGVGKADATGPVVEINLMGYASLAQIGTGLRQRLFARAFIVGSTTNANDRFVYLVVDICSGDTAIRYGILDALANLGSGYSMYNQSNVAVVGTHQHSGPGAYYNYLLPQVTSLGFDPQSYQAIVDGSTLAIQRAHESLTPGYLSYANTNVTNANINRSLYSYLNNPASERAQYDSNVDTTLTMLRFQRASDGLNTGVLCWHSVHGTSMLENNTHTTGDNKGVTEYLFEKAMENDATAAPGFVAAVSQSSVGDTTPNVLGAWCDDGSGEMCTFENSTCSGQSETCHGRGPEFQKVDLGVSSCYEIGTRVYTPAKALYDSFDSVATPVTGAGVRYYHTFNDMQYYSFPLPNGTIVQTCPAALGYGFGAGTTDGPGISDFYQNDPDSNSQNVFWAAVSGLLKTPDAAQAACQAPKPILIDAGQLSYPYDWAPNIVDVQSFRVGQFIMILSPAEATTMTGRRWKAAVAAAATSQGILDNNETPMVVLGGPSNTYAHYCATPEEYAIQRYEGASTLFGQWESYAYMHLSTSLIGYLATDNGSQPAPGPAAPDNAGSSLDFIAGVVYDSPWIGHSFGAVLDQPDSAYSIGAVVNATFVAADPRNNLRLEGTYAEVQQLVSSTWTTVRNDWDWFLVFTWYRDDSLIGSSHVVISWETETYAEAGTYRIVYHGDSKSLFGKITAFNGTSNSFTLS